MEIWFLILISLCTSFLLKPILSLVIPTIPKPKLPPGSLTIPVISNFLWLCKSFSELEPILRNLKARYGPMVTLHIGSRPAVFVADRSLAHQALIQNDGADCPPALATDKVLSSNQHNISSAVCGPAWSILRRNLTSEILQPSRVKSYGESHKWVLDILVNRLETESQSQPEGVRMVDYLQYAMFCWLVLMCFVLTCG